VGAPGVLGHLAAWLRYGVWKREFHILRRTWNQHLAGWIAGASATRQFREPHVEIGASVRQS
jgi:hypothetical protein